MISTSTFGAGYGSAASAESELAALRRLDRLARMLDSAFTIPVVGVRVGADALLNLVPGAGVVTAKGLSAWLVWEAYRLGVPKAMLGRMAANIAVDLAISIVPVAGWVADIFFRANLRNMALLRGHLAGRNTIAGRADPDEPLTIDGEVVRDDRGRKDI